MALTGSVANSDQEVAFWDASLTPRVSQPACLPSRLVALSDSGDLMSEPRRAEASAGRWALLGAHVLFPIRPSLQTLLFLSLQNNLKNSSFRPHLWPLICSQLCVHLLVSVHLIYLEVSLLSRFPIPAPAPSHSGGLH